MKRTVGVLAMVAFTFMIGWVGGMDANIEKREAAEAEYNSQAEIRQLQEDVMQLQAVVDGMSEDVYTLMDKIEFEQSDLPEEFYWEGENK